MHAQESNGTTISIHDAVIVDGQAGIVIGFYARKERMVLVRLDPSGTLEVPESRLVSEAAWIENSWHLGPRGSTLRHVPIEELTETVEFSVSAIHLR
jgi:hypothetical protein